jgi:ribokinase
MIEPSIVVVGSANVDMIIKTGRIPRPGETVIGGAFSTAGGGKGANQAVAARRLGAKVAFVAAVGHDVLGRQTVQDLSTEGLNVRYVQSCDNAATGVALIMIDEKGENSIAVASGANNELRPADVMNAASVIAAADILLLQLEIPLPTVCQAIEIAAANKVRVILNPAPAPAVALPDALWQQIDVLTPNEWEAEALTGIPVNDDATAHQAAGVLLDHGVGSVIITLGDKGAWLENREIMEHVQSVKVRAVDATAAGDVFNAALAVALAERKELRQAVRFANAAAAISVTRLGAQPSAPYRKEVNGYCW